MERGYIKAYRKTLENPIFKEPYLFQLWNYILLKVNHKPADIVWNGKLIHLEAGQGIFGLNQIVKDCSIQRDENSRKFKKLKTIYYRKLKLLENMQNLKLKTTNKYSIISVVKWDFYQSNETQVKLKRNSGETQVKTNKNDKECIRNNDKGFYCLIFQYPELTNLGKPFLEKFQEWVNYKIEIKKRFTESTIKKQLQQLNEFQLSGYDVNQIIDNSILNGWQRLFEPTSKPESNNTTMKINGTDLLNFVN